MAVTFDLRKHIKFSLALEAFTMEQGHMVKRGLADRELIVMHHNTYEVIAIIPILGLGEVGNAFFIERKWFAMTAEYATRSGV